jgi:uncharacterized membrane protein YgcG
MKHLRPLVAVGAVLAVAPAAAMAATPHHARLQRAVVVAVSGRRLSVVGPTLGVRTYAIAGSVPKRLAFGASVSMRANGARAADVRVHGRAHAVRYLATVASAARGAVTVTVAGQSTIAYRPAAAETVAMPAGTLAHGSEALVSVTVARRERVTVTRAAGAPVHSDKRAVGVITAVTPGSRRITVLTQSGLKLALTLPAAVARLAGLAQCRSLDVYYRPHGSGATATMIALPDQAPEGGCSVLQGGDGFVTAVAPSDRWVTVKAADGQTMTLRPVGRALRRAVGAVSVTDYVTFTYAARDGRDVLATLRDTSAAQSGVVTAIDRRHDLLTVSVAGQGRLKLHVTTAARLAGLAVRDKVDVDYYQAARGPLMLVNIDDQGPAQKGGNGGGRVNGGSGGSGGSGGADGSGGSAGSSSGSSGAAG